MLGTKRDPTICIAPQRNPYRDVLMLLMSAANPAIDEMQAFCDEIEQSCLLPPTQSPRSALSSADLS